jgi:GNAT superfamily N-acetyltransferase
VGIEITTDVSRIDRDRLHGWLSGAYWSRGLPRDVMDRSLDHSLCFAALRDGELVGFARLATDYATFAWLCDVFVAEDARRQGVGKRLLEAVVGHPDVQRMRRVLLSTRDADGLYAQYGFKPLEHPDRYMAITRRAEDLYL